MFSMRLTESALETAMPTGSLSSPISCPSQSNNESECVSLTFDECNSVSRTLSDTIRVASPFFSDVEDDACILKNRSVPRDEHGIKF